MVQNDMVVREHVSQRRERDLGHVRQSTSRTVTAAMWRALHPLPHIRSGSTLPSVHDLRARLASARKPEQILRSFLPLREVHCA
jgi:hypothetical protein